MNHLFIKTVEIASKISIIKNNTDSDFFSFETDLEILLKNTNWKKLKKLTLLN